MEKKVFFELVSYQDSGVEKEESEKKICEKYSITLQQLKDIQLKSINGDWLSEYDTIKKKPL